MGELPRDRHYYAVIASSTAVITSAMLCYVHPLFQIMAREWSLGSIEPYIQGILAVGICILFAIGVGVTHLHGKPRWRFSIVAALASIFIVGIAYPFVFVTKNLQVVSIAILASMITVSITTFSLLEPLLYGTQLALQCPDASAKVMSAIVAGIALGGAIGVVGYWAGSISIFWLLTAWSGIALAGAATIFWARNMPAIATPPITSKVEVDAEARGYFTEIIYTCAIALPGMVMLSASSGRLTRLASESEFSYFTVLWPASIAISALTALVTNFLRNKRSHGTRTTHPSSYAFVLATAIFTIGFSFAYFRFIDATAWFVSEPEYAYPALIYIIVVLSVFWATPVLLAMQRMFALLAKSKLPGWVNGFALGIFWLVNVIIQAFATELGNFFFNSLTAWIVGVAVACSVAGIMIIVAGGINKSRKR